MKGELSLEYYPDQFEIHALWTMTDTRFVSAQLYKNGQPYLDPSQGEFTPGGAETLFAVDLALGETYYAVITAAGGQPHQTPSYVFPD